MLLQVQYKSTDWGHYEIVIVRHNRPFNNYSLK